MNTLMVASKFRQRLLRTAIFATSLTLTSACDLTWLVPSSFKATASFFATVTTDMSMVGADLSNLDDVSVGPARTRAEQIITMARNEGNSYGGMSLVLHSKTKGTEIGSFDSAKIETQCVDNSEVISEDLTPLFRTLRLPSWRLSSSWKTKTVSGKSIRGARLQLAPAEGVTLSRKCWPTQDDQPRYVGLLHDLVTGVCQVNGATGPS